MKIGVVCYPTYGGSGVVATEIGLGLARKGHEIHFITNARPARLASFAENIFLHEVKPIDYPLFEYSPYETSLASKLVDVIIHEDLDLLHVHYAIPHAAVAFMAKNILASKGKHIPVVTTLHGTDITIVGIDGSFAPVVKFSIEQSDGVTAVSNFLAEETIDKLGVEKDVKVIYNFIDFDRFKKHDKDHFKKAIAPDGEKIITHTSNFRKVKRAEDVILAFEKIYSKVPSKLLMIGDGPERSKLENLCRQIGLCDQIRFLGKQHAVEELLAISDLFMLPSANESFGLAALEAMACHVPVVSSDVGGIPEVNIHGETGFLCQVGDIESMAKYAVELLSNPEVHLRFCENAQLRASQFDIDKILPQYESYYEEVLQEFRSEKLAVVS